MDKTIYIIFKCVRSVVHSISFHSADEKNVDPDQLASDLFQKMIIVLRKFSRQCTTHL